MSEHDAAVERAEEREERALERDAIKVAHKWADAGPPREWRMCLMQARYMRLGYPEQYAIMVSGPWRAL